MEVANGHILGLISAFHSVMSTRTSQGTIAWVVSLITFPYLAVPAYLILGRSRFNGYVKAHKASHHSIEIDKLLLEKELAPFCIPSNETSRTSGYQSAPWYHKTCHLTCCITYHIRRNQFVHVISLLLSDDLKFPPFRRFSFCRQVI